MQYQSIDNKEPEIKKQSEIELNWINSVRILTTYLPMASFFKANQRRN